MYPYIRKAQLADYDAIWRIWMQDHIIQWMSFTKQGKEEFRTHYMRMATASDIYVAVDKINEKEEIVAVRRIKFGKNQHQHIAEYCSMGVDKDFQGKGYAKFLYQEFNKIAKEAGIKRIQLTQSGGNFAAFHIADKDFFEEAVFPDWLQRQNKEGDFYLIERYMYRFIDDQLAAIAPRLPSLKYQEIIPSLHAGNTDDNITVKRINNQFVVYFKETLVLTLDFEPDDSVIRHIGFLSLQLHSQEHLSEATVALRKILSNLLAEGRVKKVELFTAEPAVAELCRNTGFFVRGEKIASFYDEKEGYKNEVGVEYSFFNIKDAQKLISAKISDPQKRESIANSLSCCSAKINELLLDNTCDTLGACYLENLIYQVVRDSLGAKRVISLDDQRWQSIIEKVPSTLHDELLRLHNRVQSKSTTFFKPEKEEIFADSANLPPSNLNRG